MKHGQLIIILTFTLTQINNSLSAQTPQRACATIENHTAHIYDNPSLKETIESIEAHTQAFIQQPQLIVRGTVIKIPVVVHVVYRNGYAAENISDAQIQTQLDVLNKDYRRLNTDRTKTPSVFQTQSADCEIEFVLAKRTPTGKSTNGIVRYASDRKIVWGKYDDVKMPEKGGFAPWNPSKYMNIYVCAIGGGILGYSSMPGSMPNIDGVVIDYRYFGTINVISPFDKGRTTTHEVGHWLNLKHIWGDSDCGDDHVADTPTQATANFGCTNFPHTSCGSSNGDMFMNYMDYTDDDCMNMFTKGQKARIQALFSAGGAREGILNSDALIPVGETSITQAITCKDDFESNNSIKSAQSISLNTSINAMIDTKEDNDYFTFSNSSEAQNIKISLSNIPFDYDLKLYNEKYQLVGSSSKSGNTDEKIILNNAPVGNYFVRVYAYSGNSNASCYNLSVNVSSADYPKEQNFTREGYLKENEILRVYPNPVYDILNINLDVESEGVAEAHIFDLRGNEVLSKSQEVSKSNNIFPVDIKTLNNGLYLLTVKNGYVFKTQKVIVQRH